MKIAYFDCFSGVSGNMVLGALVDAGLEVERLRAELARLPISGYTLSAETVRRRGLRGTYVEVEVSEQGVERHLHQIEELIQSSDLPGKVQDLSLAVFRRLAEAEARVHGISVEQVHFHEVGAVDAIVDVVGAAVGLWLLEVERVYASPVHVGRGTVMCAHGTLPVPAPATQELLRGVPIYGRDVEAELVTPTGAAILTTLVGEFGSAPPMQVAQVGYGAGSRDLPIPNLLRVSIGATSEEVEGYEEDVVTLIETNIDDMNPQFYGHVMGRLFDAGALDVFLTPIQMKGGRPGVQLSVLVSEGRVAGALEVLFAETTTIGVRTCAMRRWKLGRERVVVETRYGPVGVKVARRGQAVVNVAPEYRECQRIAEEQGVPLKEVYQSALEAARLTLQATFPKAASLREGSPPCSSGRKGRS
jgi:uncharacterized protein (TIGR00299 family) protein